jgi:hypothetical protein
MWRLLVLTLLVLAFNFSVTRIYVFAQETTETENLSEAAVKEAVEDVAGALKGVIVLRVSEKYLESLFARDINKHTKVNRVVLGTRATGNAHTVGRADVDTKPAKNDAAFYVKISGTTTSSTTGRNGPAIIHSRSITKWISQKVVRFDGENFKAGPATIESTTKITPMGADSILPGIRGRLVSRVATKRAREYNSRAERISGKDTEKQVLSDVDRVVDGQIQKLNDRLDTRPMMTYLLPKLDDMGVTFSTSSNCINVSFAGGESSPLAKVCPVEGLEPSDTELWFQTALIARPDGTIPGLVDNAGAWLADALPDLGLPGVDIVGQDGVMPFNVKVVDGWVVVRSNNLTLPTVAAKGDQKASQ